MSVLDRQVREDLRATIDLARRERIETQERRDAELREMEEARTERNRQERELRSIRSRRTWEEKRAATAAKEKADAEAAALIDAIVLAPAVSCHTGLRATRCATGADRANDLADFRCPRCRMILDGPA